LIERVGNFSGIDRQSLFCRLDVCDVIALGIQLKRDGRNSASFDEIRILYCHIVYGDCFSNFSFPEMVVNVW
jgi:hypothetical protein